jgi:hypothetical protein
MRASILEQLVEKARSLLPIMPSNGDSANAYDVLDLQFVELERLLECGDGQAVTNVLAEMMCWMVIIAEERKVGPGATQNADVLPGVKSRAFHRSAAQQVI